MLGHAVRSALGPGLWQRRKGAVDLLKGALLCKPPSLLSPRTPLCLCSSGHFSSSSDGLPHTGKSTWLDSRSLAGPDAKDGDCHGSSTSAYSVDELGLQTLSLALGDKVNPSPTSYEVGKNGVIVGNYVHLSKGHEMPAQSLHPFQKILQKELYHHPKPIVDSAAQRGHLHFFFEAVADQVEAITAYS
ncbi:Hypothetical predicted protein [Marmota monax]|uniref:Uncharacterized protein n=1 Tax=Marmota monax TaxID=9995 RepID=A0A5E4AGM5_MARMO|nr:Hypothetical predicted protein [Marmota monax]